MADLNAGQGVKDYIKELKRLGVKEGDFVLLDHVDPVWYLVYDLYWDTSGFFLLMICPVEKGSGYSVSTITTNASWMTEKDLKSNLIKHIPFDSVNIEGKTA